MPRTTKRRVVVDNTRLAAEIGGRIRSARLQVGLTQQQLAEGRYTKAYVSALEKGQAKPSIAALTFFAERLGLPPTHFLADPAGAWTRLEADIHLAAGNWRAAADAYEALLPLAADRRRRAEILRGLAEGLCRLDEGGRAITAAAEAVEIFRALGRRTDAALASYWLSFAHYIRENRTEARALLADLLEQVRAGLDVAPDFKMRLLVAMAMNESRDGEHERALTYLEEARALSSEMDDRRRATFLFSLAISYRETGDLEAAVRTGAESLALFRAANAEFEVGSLENELALTYLALGNLRRAAELAAASRTRFEQLADNRWLAHVLDTQARIALAEGLPDQALTLARAALRLAEDADNEKAKLDALLTRAKAEAATGDTKQVLVTYEAAARLARERGTPAQVREALGEWAAALASSGRHDQAYELTREALKTRS
jgi:tetratricopeptide (TPR) repeat protein